ncbi:MAG: hypothetical protein RLZZ505_2614 [Verrucomicrobiota bacterium]|jgi:hypothetical protein
MKEWSSIFLRSLVFWSLHGVVSALPGFCIAMWMVRLSENPSALLAMLSALLTIILVIASLMSFRPSLTAWRTLPSRGLRCGLVLRAICSGASFLIVITVLATNGRDGNPVLIALPDLWTGLGAVLTVAAISDFFSSGNPFSGIFDLGGPANLSFAMIYLISLIHGLILCFLIFIVSFVSMLVLQIRDRKKFYQNAAAYGFRDPDSEAGLSKIPQGKVQQVEEQA